MRPAQAMAMTSVSIWGDVRRMKTLMTPLSTLSTYVTIPLRSRIHIRDQLTFHARDLILEHQLALFEALQLQLIGMDIHREALDDFIEITMLDAQRAQLLDVAEQLAIDVVFDFRHGWCS